MTALATVTELELHLGRPIPPAGTEEMQAELALDAASAVIRGYARQTLTTTTSTDVQLAGTWGPVLQLPERPVTAVTAVTITHPSGVTDVVDMGTVLWRRDGTVRRTTDATANAAWAGPDATVEVTYTHGFAAVPDDVRHVVLALAGRIYDNPTAARQQQMGSFMEIITPPTLQAAETLVLDRYRQRTATL